MPSSSPPPRSTDSAASAEAPRCSSRRSCFRRSRRERSRSSAATTTRKLAPSCGDRRSRRAPLRASPSGRSSPSSVAAAIFPSARCARRADDDESRSTCCSLARRRACRAQARAAIRGDRQGRGRGLLDGAGGRVAARRERGVRARESVEAVTVYLVGAGPGDPGLITVRGAELLARPTSSCYDRLASPRVARSRAGDGGAHRRRQGAGARSRWRQDDIDALLVERGQTGATVVRLKGGDPFVFGRGGEEAEALRAAGVAVRGRARRHERDRRARVRGDPRDASRALDARHDRHRPRRPGQGHAPTPTGRARRAPAARSWC